MPIEDTHSRPLNTLPKTINYNDYYTTGFPFCHKIMMTPVSNQDRSHGHNLILILLCFSQDREMAPLSILLFFYQYICNFSDLWYTMTQGRLHGQTGAFA